MTRVLAVGNFDRHAYAHHWQGIRAGFAALDGDVVLETLDYRDTVGAHPITNVSAPGADLKAADAIREKNSDIVLFGLQDAMTDDVLDACSACGAFVALWFCDLRWPDQRDLTDRLHLLAMTNVGLSDEYAAAWGISSDDIIWLPQGCLKRQRIAEYDASLAADLLFVGSFGHPEFHDIRRDVLKSIEATFGARTVIGHGPNRDPGGLVVYNPAHDVDRADITRKLDRLYASATVSIGVSDPVAGYHSNRLFLATGHGAFYFCNWFPGVETLFEPNAEIELFDPFESGEYLARLKWLTSDDPVAARRRVELRWNAFVRAQNDHTYEKRIALLWEAIQKRTAKKGVTT